MSRKSLHCKSLVLGYYPILPEMFWSSGFLILRRKNRWKIIYDGSYGKLFSRSFSSFFQWTFLFIVFLITCGGTLFTKEIKEQNAMETTGHNFIKCLPSELTHSFSQPNSLTIARSFRCQVPMATLFASALFSSFVQALNPQATLQLDQPELLLRLFERTEKSSFTVDSVHNNKFK